MQKLWSQVPTAENSNSLKEYIKPLFDFLLKKSNEDDIIFVQGEFGMTSLVVQWCYIHNRIPIYATTKREAVEVHNEDGSVTMQHKFVHAGFRRFEKL